MLQGDPSSDGSHGSVPQDDILSTIRQMFTLLPTDGRKLTKVVATQVQEHVAQLECKFLRFRRHVNEIEMIAEAHRLCQETRPHQHVNPNTNNNNQEVNALRQEIEALKQELLTVKAQKYDEFRLGYAQERNTTNRNDNNSPGDGEQPRRSYAQACRIEVRPPAVKLPAKTSHVVVIQPKADDGSITDSTQTLQLFQIGVDPKTLMKEKICIKSKKLTSKKRVVVSCGSRDECQALCDAMAGDKFITATIPKKKKPLVQILGIDMNIPKEEIFGYVVNQNDALGDCAECSFEVKFEKTDRFGSKFAVAEVDPKLYKRLLEVKKVCIGHTACPVKERIRVMRCYQCHRFGHIKKDCRSEVVCVVCAGPHEAKDCKETDVKCSNCDWVNEKRKQRKQQPLECDHRADNKTCPQFQRMCRIVESQYDFG